MRLLAGATLAGLITIALVGCGGDDSGESERTTAAADTTSSVFTDQTPTTVPGSATSAAPTAETTAVGAATTVAPAEWPPPQEKLDAALLTIADMPTGWATVTRDDTNTTCDATIWQVLGIDEDDLPIAEFIAAEDEDLGPIFGDFVMVLPPDAPDDVMTEWRNRMLDCEEKEDGFDVSFSELSFPPMGDESIAVRLNLTKDERTVHIDRLIMRTGDIIVSLDAFNVFGDATELLTEYAQIALDRATSALS